VISRRAQQIVCHQSGPHLLKSLVGPDLQIPVLVDARASVATILRAREAMSSSTRRFAGPNGAFLAAGRVDRNTRAVNYPESRRVGA
jgi:hypothetical protein